MTQGHHPTKAQWSFPCRCQAFLPPFLRGANAGDGDRSSPKAQWDRKGG